MGLGRFEDEDGHLVLDTEAREYIQELTGVDRGPEPPPLPPACPAERAGFGCTLSRGHEGRHWGWVPAVGREEYWE